MCPTKTSRYGFEAAAHAASTRDVFVAASDRVLKRAIRNHDLSSGETTP